MQQSQNNNGPNKIKVVFPFLGLTREVGSSKPVAPRSSKTDFLPFVLLHHPHGRQGPRWLLELQLSPLYPRRQEGREEGHAPSPPILLAGTVSRGFSQSGLRALVCMSGALGRGLSWGSVWGFISIKWQLWAWLDRPRTMCTVRTRAPLRLGNKDGQRK